MEGNASAFIEKGREIGTEVNIYNQSKNFSVYLVYFRPVLLLSIEIGGGGWVAGGNLKVAERTKIRKRYHLDVAEVENNSFQTLGKSRPKVAAATKSISPHKVAKITTPIGKFYR